MKKIIASGIVVLLVLALLPLPTAFAAPLLDDPNPEKGKDAYPRVEKAFVRVNEWFDKQSEFLAKSDEYIQKAEAFIGKAEERGLDTTSLRSLLEAFAGSIPAVQAAHDRAGVIIAAHNGFDEAGKVVNIAEARQTVKDAATALQEGRQAHLGKGKALAEAIRAFWQDNRPPRQEKTDGSIPPAPNE